MSFSEETEMGFPALDEIQPFDGVNVVYVEGTDSLDLPDTRPDEDDIEAAWNDEIEHEAEDKEYKATQPPGGYYEVAQLEGTRDAKEAKYYIKKEDGTFALVTKNRLRVRYSGRGIREHDGNT